MFGIDFKLIFFFIFLWGIIPLGSCQNLVQNGNADTCVISPWSASSSSSSGWEVYNTPANAHSGSCYFLTNCQSGCSALSQTISLLTTHVYLLTFYSRTSSGSATMVSVQIGSITLFSNLGIGGSWQLYTASFGANSNSMVLSFVGSVPSGAALRIDDVSIYDLTPTSQPTSSPTCQPSGSPTTKPTEQPTTQPSAQPSTKPSAPSSLPTSQPSRKPTSQPVSVPTSVPFSQPSSQPYSRPTSQPFSQPSSHPTSQPSRQPTSQPISFPTRVPSSQPSRQPSLQPTSKPSDRPTSQPISSPTSLPSNQPSRQPNSHPTSQPSCQPSSQPISQPSGQPSSQPISVPTRIPSSQPSNLPSMQPTSLPTQQPSDQPSVQPSATPSTQPTSQPSVHPSIQPSAKPTIQPSSAPSQQPTNYPTSQPTAHPSFWPSSQPTSVPSTQPSASPSSIPSSQPSNIPTAQPTSLPSSQPSCSPSCQPSIQPTAFPSSQPTLVPTSQPTTVPTTQPTSFPSPQPSGRPTDQPSAFPSSQPTDAPSRQPTRFPSAQPTGQPSEVPSGLPTTQPSSQPSSFPSSLPSTQPSSLPSNQPSNYPTLSPSSQPTLQPTSFPSMQPTSLPSVQPTSLPSEQPFVAPSSQPSSLPTNLPTSQPSLFPSSQPTVHPSTRPSNQPSTPPTCQPSTFPSPQPSTSPTSQPSNVPTSQPTCKPTLQPSAFPTGTPTAQPSYVPSTQPTCCPSSPPSSQPFAFPTTKPSIIPSSHPSSQPSAIPTSAPVVAFYQEEGVLFYLGKQIDPITSLAPPPAATKSIIPAASYILFGQKEGFPAEITLLSQRDLGYASLIKSIRQGGVLSDVVSRSTTTIGDINGDGFTDIVIGKPYSSICSIFLGTEDSAYQSIGDLTTAAESFRIVGDISVDGGTFGWSAVKLGDLNNDGFADLVISSMGNHTIYVIYGRLIFPNIIYLSELTLSDGFKIVGFANDKNFGVAMTSLQDFNRDGYRDLAITSMITNGNESFSQNVIYVLLLTKSLRKNQDIYLEQLDSQNLLKIITPPYSFAGFSIAGIGDINHDGFDDLAIGSLPYSAGDYIEQLTYVVYGSRLLPTSGSIDLSSYLSDGKGGFVVRGAGFLVHATGDVNGDLIPDFMITNFEGWSTHGNAYLIRSPSNFTASPTFYPSSSPSLLPTAFPSNDLVSSYPTSRNSLRTKAPDLNNPLVPSPAEGDTNEPTRVVFVLSTDHPSKRPTKQPVMKRTPKSHHPSIQPTRLPYPFNLSHLFFLEYPDPGNYNGKEDSNNEYLITGRGSYQFTGTYQKHNIYVIYPLPDQIIEITNFQIDYDIIDLTHFPYLQGLNRLTYLYQTSSQNMYQRDLLPSSLVISLFSPGNREQQVVLPTVQQFTELTERNFIFYTFNDSPPSRQILVFILPPIVIVMISIAFYYFISYIEKNENIDEIVYLKKRRLKYGHEDFVDEDDNEDEEESNEEVVNGVVNDFISSRKPPSPISPLSIDIQSQQQSVFPSTRKFRNSARNSLDSIVSVSSVSSPIYSPAITIHDDDYYDLTSNWSILSGRSMTLLQESQSKMRDPLSFSCLSSSHSINSFEAIEAQPLKNDYHQYFSGSQCFRGSSSSDSSTSSNSEHDNFSRLSHVDDIEDEEDDDWLADFFNSRKGSAIWSVSDFSEELPELNESADDLSEIDEDDDIDVESSHCTILNLNKNMVISRFSPRFHRIILLPLLKMIFLGKMIWCDAIVSFIFQLLLQHQSHFI